MAALSAVLILLKCGWPAPLRAAARREAEALHAALLGAQNVEIGLQDDAIEEVHAADYLDDLSHIATHVSLILLLAHDYFGDLRSYFEALQLSLLIYLCHNAIGKRNLLIFNLLLFFLFLLLLFLRWLLRHSQILHLHIVELIYELWQISSHLKLSIVTLLELSSQTVLEDSCEIFILLRFELISAARLFLSLLNLLRIL